MPRSLPSEPLPSDPLPSDPLPSEPLPSGLVATAVPRVRRAPSLEPPTTDGATALQLVPPVGRRHRHAPAPPTRVPHPPVDPGALVGAQIVLRLALEVLDGRRSPQQLRALLPSSLVDAVTTRARTAVGRRRQPARLGLVHVQMVSPTVAEAFALVDRGPCAHAAAARMQLVDRSWRCTALWLG